MTEKAKPAKEEKPKNQKIKHPAASSGVLCAPLNPLACSRHHLMQSFRFKHPYDEM
jgi:hypothetical protein